MYKEYFYLFVRFFLQIFISVYVKDYEKSKKVEIEFLKYRYLLNVEDGRGELRFFKELRVFNIYFLEVFYSGRKNRRLGEIFLKSRCLAFGSFFQFCCFVCQRYSRLNFLQFRNFVYSLNIFFSILKIRVRQEGRKRFFELQKVRRQDRIVKGIFQ